LESILRSIIAGRCVRRTIPEQQEPIAVWARKVAANPSAHHATEREAEIVAELLAELEAQR
jgi:hypothetical protein